MLKRRFVWLVVLSSLLMGCDPYADMAMLDKGIPRVETPNVQIATVRFKVRDGKFKQTALFDKQNRLLEAYNFGRSNSRVRVLYDGPLKVYTITHCHAEDDATGHNTVTQVDYKYDQRGRLVEEREANRGFEKWSKLSQYRYTARGDTISYVTPKSTDPIVANVNRWTYNRHGQLVGHYTLYAVQRPESSRPDTLSHYYQRYVYSSAGRRRLAWYESVSRYMGWFGCAEADVSDTTHYQYDTQGRLIGELHRNRRYSPNKIRKGLDRLPDNQIHQIRYTYEPFNPSRHLPLQIPPLN